MRLAFLGMQSVFSTRALAALLEEGHDVACVVMPTGGTAGRRRPWLARDRGVKEGLKRRLLGHLEPPDPASRDPFALAREHGLPRYWVGDASAEPVVELLRRLKVEGAAIAFFNQLLRRPLLEALPGGVVNAHPSLLPRHRGPAPLFWTFREGDERTGVTVHRVTRGEDDGPVLARREVHVAFGQGGEELLDELADHAAEALPAAVRALEADAQGEPQPEGEVTRARRPQAADLWLSARQPARRLYHFVRGVGRWNGLIVEAGDAVVRVVDAVGYDEERRPPGEWMWVGDVLLLACDPGMVELRVVPLKG